MRLVYSELPPLVNVILHWGLIQIGHQSPCCVWSSIGSRDQMTPVWNLAGTTPTGVVRHWYIICQSGNIYLYRDNVWGYIEITIYIEIMISLSIVLFYWYILSCTLSNIVYNASEYIIQYLMEDAHQLSW